MIKEYIPCARFGGQRPAVVCCTQDRYRYCRKRCRALADLIKEKPEFPEEALKQCRKSEDNSGTKWLYSMKHANKNLPPTNPLLRCNKCGFVARSIRGLKAHNTRQHG